MRKPLSSYHPWLYALRVFQRRLFKKIDWMLSDRIYANAHSSINLAHRHKKSTSKLIRKLGESDVQLQINKVQNLKIAASCIDGIIIKPNQYFSFCKTVGRATKKRGFLEGMELSNGQARAGIGGGICQASNLLHWLSLHSPLQVVERAQHSFDPFPDDGRVLPFGSGAAIFYNYIDLVLYNPTPFTFQFRLSITEKELEGLLLSDEARAVTYHIYEKYDRFVRKNNAIYRENEIWRKTCTKDNIKGAVITLDDVLLYKNSVQVKYPVDPEKITH